MEFDVLDVKTALEHVLTDAADGVFVLDSEYRCVWLNRACERITGYSASEILGTNCRRLEPVADSGEGGGLPVCAFCPDLHALSNPCNTLRQQVRIDRKDGSTARILGQFIPLRDKCANLKGILGILRAPPAVERDETRLDATSENLPPHLHDELLDVVGKLDRPLDDVLASVERNAILAALRRTEGRRSQAARDMGISRSRLYRRMEALGIRPRDDL